MTVDLEKARELVEAQMPAIIIRAREILNQAVDETLPLIERGELAEAAAVMDAARKKVVDHTAEVIATEVILKKMVLPAIMKDICAKLGIPEPAPIGAASGAGQ